MKLYVPCGSLFESGAYAARCTVWSDGHVEVDYVFTADRARTRLTTDDVALAETAALGERVTLDQVEARIVARAREIAAENAVAA